MLTTENIRQTLRSQPATDSLKTNRRAAVAMILLGPGQAEELLFIRRAEYPGDPWSGDVAFPGGGVEKQDTDSRATAERETHEEVGLQLPDAAYLGPLGEISGAYIPVSIAGHIYLLDKLPPLQINAEVINTFSVPLRVLCENTRNRQQTFDYRGKQLTHPTIDLAGYCDRFLWGISYRLLQKFLGIIKGNA